MTDQSLYVIQHLRTDAWYEVDGPQSEYEGYHKIGISSDPRERLRMLQPGTPHKLKLITTVAVDGNAEVVESEYHRALWPSHIRGEWFKLLPKQVDHFKQTESISDETSRSLLPATSERDFELMFDRR